MKELNPKILEAMGLEAKDFEPAEVSQADRTEAQALYTAIMTDTLLED